MGTTSVRVEATFELRGRQAEQLASEATEMIDRLHQLSHRTDCECDVDVNLRWHQGRAGEGSAAS